MVNSYFSQKQIMLLLFILFHDGYVLQLRAETVAVRRRIRNGLDDYDSQMVYGDKCDLNFLKFVLHLRENPGKKSQPGNWPDRDLNPGSVDERQRRYPSATVVVNYKYVF